MSRGATRSAGRRCRVSWRRACPTEPRCRAAASTGWSCAADTRLNCATANNSNGRAWQVLRDGAWCLRPVFVESCAEQGFVQVCGLSPRTLAGRDPTDQVRCVPVGSLVRPVGNGPVDVTCDHAAYCGTDAALQALYSGGLPTSMRYLTHGLLSPGSRCWVRVSVVKENEEPRIAALPSVSPFLVLPRFSPSTFTRRALPRAAPELTSVLAAYHSRGLYRCSPRARTCVTGRRRPLTYVHWSLRNVLVHQPASHAKPSLHACRSRAPLTCAAQDHYRRGTDPEIVCVT